MAQAPLAEALATAALFLQIAAVIASAVCLGTFALGQAYTAMTAGGLALVTFAASLAGFAFDARLQQASGGREEVITAIRR
jgi:hypothetical protein